MLALFLLASLFTFLLAALSGSLLVGMSGSLPIQPSGHRLVPPEALPLLLDLLEVLHHPEDSRAGQKDESPGQDAPGAAFDPDPTHGEDRPQQRGDQPDELGFLVVPHVHEFGRGEREAPRHHHQDQGRKARLDPPLQRL